VLLVVRLSDDERRALNGAMDRYAEGDGGAFGEVHDLLAPRLLSYFVRQGADDALAEDLVQHTLLRMHGARASYRAKSDVLPWAFAIARRLLIDARRRTRKELLQASTEDELEANAGRADRSSDPADLAIAKQAAGAVRDELGRLPAGQRDAYELVRGEGLSVAQAARALGTTPTAVKLRLHRVYEALRATVRGQEKSIVR
jgi:RNA polymerase sigma-70 factor (ECF subfamily)